MAPQGTSKKEEEKDIECAFSVIIPCRNEASNIGACLNAIAKQDFPIHLFEILVVDDHSEDNTKDQAHAFFRSNPKIKGRVIQLHDSLLGGKKEAITEGVMAAQFSLIVTTDADCIASSTWLKSLATCYQIHRPKMIVAPVSMSPSNSIMNQFQELELLGLQLVAGGGIQLEEPVLCNGANLCYEKAAFIHVGGYLDNAEIASGDDLFILQKISKKYPGEVKYLKSMDALVQTRASHSPTALMQQRRRWVSKVIRIPDFATIAVALIVYLTHLSLVINLISWMLLPDFNGSFLIITFAAKAVIDFLFLHLATTFFRRSYLMRLFVFAELLYLFYVSMIGVFGNMGRYNWKGRSSDRGSIVSNNS